MTALPAAAARFVLAGTAAAHDYHVGADGAYAAALDAIATARAAGAGIEIETPLSRSTYRLLAAMPAELRARGAARWRLRVLSDTDVDDASRARLVPRLAMALPHALHAATRAQRAGLPTVIVDAPRCLLGTLAEVGVVERERGHPAPCLTCTVRPACAGVDPGYVARFGTDELRPR
ncbi:MAG: hypothetical protein R3B06_05700 [Kofleriaceae bacterium]